MARGMTLYKNSILASIVSIFGYGFMMLGVISLMDKEYVMGIVFIIAGFGLMMLASKISENKRFRAWKKDVETRGLAPHIQNSENYAIECYNTCPCKKTLEYIRTLNPAAAENISRQLAAKK